MKTFTFYFAKSEIVAKNKKNHPYGCLCTDFIPTLSEAQFVYVLDFSVLKYHKMYSFVWYIPKLLSIKPFVLMNILIHFIPIEVLEN